MGGGDESTLVDVLDNVQSFGDGVALFFKDPDGMRIEIGVNE